MDAKRTGTFIAALRRELGMTQRELADAIAVTDKAVSRWETGKGYPDVETLAPLAEALGVTVGDLLAGESTNAGKAVGEGVSLAPTVANGVPPHVVGDLYQKTVRSEIRARRFKIALIVVSCALAALIAGIFVHRTADMLQNTVFAVDEKCMIAADYSHITYNGRRYVPVVLSHELEWGQIIVREAAVEGESRWDKLLFGDTVYSVEGFPGGEMIYLGTDYDLAPSNYYCLESEVERIKQYDREGFPDVYVAQP